MAGGADLDALNSLLQVAFHLPSYGGAHLLDALVGGEDVGHFNHQERREQPHVLRHLRGGERDNRLRALRPAASQPVKSFSIKNREGCESTPRTSQHVHAHATVEEKAGV